MFPRKKVPAARNPALAAVPDSAAPGQAPATVESLGQQLRSAVSTRRLHCLTLCDREANVLWLSEGALGPDEHSLLTEGLEALGRGAHVPFHEITTEDSRRAIFLPVRAPHGKLVGVAMFLGDGKGVGDDTMERMTGAAVRVVMQRLAVLMKPAGTADNQPNTSAAPAPATQPELPGPASAGTPLEGGAQEEPVLSAQDTNDILEFELSAIEVTQSFVAPVRAAAVAAPDMVALEFVPSDTSDADAVAPVAGPVAAPTADAAAEQPAAELPAAESAGATPPGLPTAQARATASPEAPAEEIIVDEDSTDEAPLPQAGTDDIPLLSAAESDIADVAPVAPVAPPMPVVTASPVAAASPTATTAPTANIARATNTAPAPEPAPAQVARAVASDSSLVIEVLEYARLRAGGQTRRYQVAASRSAQGGRQQAASDALMLERLLRFLSAHRTAWNSQPTSFSVSLSIASIEDERFLPRMINTFNQHGISPDTIGFEITEALCAQRRAQVERFISQCDKAGTWVVIDDFSFDSQVLPLLRSRALRLVKIDPKLTGNALKDKLSQAVVVATVQAAKVMGIHCSARKVDTQAALQWLKAIGCDFAQGAALGTPQPLESLAAAADPTGLSARLG
ncbi:MAG: EAL domain-containing protein [Proteobacteria bacterium]|nr:EAL domain-containing protein [Pseudomonadota bacterium]